jgi:acyl-CoA oxidase
MSKDTHLKYNHTRGEALKDHVKDFIGIHHKYQNFRPTRKDIAIMTEISVGYGSLNNSHSIFMLTVVGQGSPEQQRYWVPKIMNFEITGTYAQTELGHGSNVRGLSTTADYDIKTDEFILNTPTLCAMKWWPGCLGKVGTHAVVYAQLKLDGKEQGLNVFMMQIRDENHLPLPGITLGDLGNKIGDNANDTGFMTLDNVRIPRTHILSKYHTVTREGKYVTVLKADPQVHYTTMMSTRAMMANTAGARLCQSAVMAIRYSCVRQQGFTSNKAGVSYKTPEFQIVDYKIQQYRLFKQLALAYALKFNGTWMLEQLSIIEGGEWGQIKTTVGLKELAAASAGMKSLCSMIAINGIEDLRKCCGGNGYLLNSGIAGLGNDYLWQITAEGDVIILGLMTARFLHQSIDAAIAGKKNSGNVEYLNVLNNKNFSIKSQTPLPARDSAEYFNISYLETLFKYRSLERCHSFNSAVNKLIKDKKMKFQDAFNALNIEGLRATYAHCYYLILQNFISNIKACKSEKIVAALTRVCALFVCTNLLDDNWGDLLEVGQFRMIRTAVARLMEQIRPDCIALTDAFDIDDNILKSTIGRYDGNVYEALYDAAQQSTLNQQEVFEGYEQYLKPHLNMDVLRRGNKPIPESGKF